MSKEGEFLSKLFNSLNLLTWFALQLSITIALTFSQRNYTISWVSLVVLRLAQSLQVLDMVLILMKISPGSLVSTLPQFVGRCVVCFFFVEEDTQGLRFALMAICWSVADIIRYLYYLFKESTLLGLLRYHAFLLLYPLGVYAEMLVTNDYIKRHAQTITDQSIYIIRIIQISIVIGMLVLYAYMIRMRSKFMKKYRLDNNKKVQ